MGMLMQEMSRLARQAGGSNKTVHDRMALAQRFCERLVVVQNIQIRQVAQLKARHIEDYIRERLQQGITRRSLQNEMAAIRSLLVQAGRDKLAVSERISNRALGLAGGSHTGTHRAIPAAYYR
ncbi:phage integrase N-terminal domain-containing protein, partial [Citrobacter koseri]|uniref:phage integrase N-terminal domain-containing protein n=1 Tax=Citrobacter koseri TaxID=545 RepID=UPI000664D93B